MGFRSLLTIALLMQLTLAAVPQAKPTDNQVVVLPKGPVTRISSPDRRWTLIFECPNYSKERKLWIKGNSSTRRLVGQYERSLAVGWAPDSKRFFVNDDYGSNGSLSFVIDPVTLKKTDLSTVISGRDPSAARLLKAGHSYVRARHWLDAHRLLVVLFGHFDGLPPRGAPGAFTVRYRVDLNGGVERLSSRPIGEP